MGSRKIRHNGCTCFDMSIGFIDVFNPVNIFYYYNFCCNINCNVGSHKIKHNGCTRFDMSIGLSSSLSCTRPVMN